MKGILAMPIGSRFMTANRTMLCLMRLVEALRQKFGSVQLSVNEISIFEYARNNLMENCDWMLMADSDMVFSVEDGVNIVTECLEKKLDVVSALYFKGFSPYDPCIYEPKVLEVYHKYPKNSLFEIAYCGFGFVAINGNTIKRLPPKPFTPLERQKGILLEPDLSFCHRVRELGMKVWCDSRIKVGHLRMFDINENNVSAIRNL